MRPTFPKGHQMPNKPKSSAPGAGKTDNDLRKPGDARKATPHWAAKSGRGLAPVLKPLRLPGKGRGG
jgi:hypothetical protein